MEHRKTIAALLPLILSAGISANILSNYGSTARAETTTSATAVTTTVTTQPTPVSEPSPSVILAFDKKMVIGEEYAINAKDNGMTYSSDNESVASVSDSGIIKAVGSGTATVSVMNSKNDVVEINVKVSELIPAKPFGDINGDGSIDGRDATALLTYYAKTSTGYTESLERFVEEQASETVTSAANPVTGAVSTTTTSESPGYISSIDSRYIMWIDIADEQDYVFNDKFIKLTFKVKDNIPDNDYKIRFNADLSNIKGNAIHPDKVYNGTIRVGSESIDPIDVSSENGFTVYGDNIACKQGDTVDCFISLRNNPGICGALMWVYFDKNAMDIVSVQPAGEFTDIAKKGDFSFGSRPAKTNK